MLLRAVQNSSKHKPRQGEALVGVGATYMYVGPGQVGDDTRREEEQGMNLGECEYQCSATVRDSCSACGYQFVRQGGIT
jgi:hypothetical protein